METVPEANENLRTATLEGIENFETMKKTKIYPISVKCNGEQYNNNSPNLMIFSNKNQFSFTHLSGNEFEIKKLIPKKL